MSQLFVAIAQDKYDCWQQNITYLGVFTTIEAAQAQIVHHKQNYYYKNCEEFDYFCFATSIDTPVIARESDSISVDPGDVSKGM